MVKSHIFREDLYYRINVIPLQIPALRERPDDVVALAENFIKVSSILNSRNVTKLSLGALNKLSQWNWPGNVRELENVIERAVLMANQGEIQSEHIIIENFTSSPGTPSNSGMTAGMTIAQMERELIYKTLDKTNQNRTQAARILGISIRTLRNKLHEYRGDHG